MRNFKPPPFVPPEDTKTFKDIQYSSHGHIRQRLDLYLPKDEALRDSPLPLIVYIHGRSLPELQQPQSFRAATELKCAGGAFKYGSKESPWMPSRLISKGYAIASLDYRLSGDAVFPAAVEDCKAAVRWLRAHATEYRLDSNRFVAFGESAGAHHASFLGVTSPAGAGDELDVGDHLDQSSAVQGVVDYYGPSDFLQMDAHAPADGNNVKHDPPGSPESLYVGAVDGIQNAPEKSVRANPITYLSEAKAQGVPPFFISHGVNDHVVPYHQSVLLYEALKKVGVPVTLHPVEGADHVFGGISPEQSDDLDNRTDIFLASISH